MEVSSRNLLNYPDLLCLFGGFGAGQAKTQKTDLRQKTGGETRLHQEDGDVPSFIVLILGDGRRIRGLSGGAVFGGRQFEA